MTAILACAAVLVLVNCAFLMGYAMGEHDTSRRPALNQTVRQVHIR